MVEISFHHFMFTMRTHVHRGSIPDCIREKRVRYPTIHEPQKCCTSFSHSFPLPNQFKTYHYIYIYVFIYVISYELAYLMI